jgi:DNA anti-recombination protein RmuC
VTALVDLLFLLVGITLGAFVMYARQRGERAAIDALLERAKNDLREATTHQAGERVGQIVAPIAERLTEFDRMVREIENKRSEDSGALREQLTQLLGRADKIETAANAL